MEDDENERLRRKKILKEKYDHDYENMRRRFKAEIDEENLHLEKLNVELAMEIARHKKEQEEFEEEERQMRLHYAL